MPIGVDSKISIIIPAYNEEARISNTLQEYLKYFSSHYENTFEIIVVLNGCKDKTVDKVISFTNKYPELKYVVFEEAIGKGGAIKEGLKIAKGEYVGFTDADNSTRPEILHRLFAVLQIVPTLDCVIGSRRMVGSVVKGKNKRRKVMSWGFNFLVNLLFQLGFKDTQCGAKVVRKNLIPKLIPTLTISDMAFDVNFLVDAKRNAAKILEIPIEWEDSEGSKVNSIKTSIAMFLSIIRLRAMYSPLNVFYPALDPIGEFILKMLNGGKSIPKNRS